MNNLNGKTILIGKEPGQGRLMVAVMGTGKSGTIGTPGSVPNCVSRCMPESNMAHAKLEIDMKGNMTLTNMKPQNVTYVNGSEIVSKRVTADSVIELGKDRFRINISMILNLATKLLQPAGGSGNPEKEYNIKHLERIWNDYQKKISDVYKEQRRVNLIRSGCSIFTMCAMPCIFVLGPVGYILTAIGIIGAIYSFVAMTNDPREILKKLEEEFQGQYICPNPDCVRFLGNGSYAFMKNQYKMHCPHCKCKYVEK